MAGGPKGGKRHLSYRVLKGLDSSASMNLVIVLVRETDPCTQTFRDREMDRFINSSLRQLAVS